MHPTPSARYPTATEEEVKQYADTCAICRDDMQSAKRLPCGHLFHLYGLATGRFAFSKWMCR
jgi:hypothetical protein